MVQEADGGIGEEYSVRREALGIWVAKKPCGCLTAAAFDEQTREQSRADLARDIGEWVLRGDVVEHRDTDTIRIERCHLHKNLTESRRG